MTAGWSVSSWPNPKPPALFEMKPDQEYRKCISVKDKSINEDSVLEPTGPVKRAREREQRKTEWTKEKKAG